MQYPRYTNIIFYTRPYVSKLSIIRKYLILTVAPYSLLSPIRAYIKSPTISNNKQFAFYNSHKKPMVALNSPTSTRKSSDSSNSSTSISKEQIMPVKRGVAERKQKRWAVKNGINVSEEEDSFYTRNKVQLQAAMYLRKLSYSLISPISKFQDYKLKGINYDSGHHVYLKNESSLSIPAFSSETKKDSKSPQKPKDVASFITLIHCESQSYKRMRRKTSGGMHA